MKALPDWRDIPEWEGFYQVSDSGDVRSVARTVVYSNGRRVNLASRPRKLTLSFGYHRVTLTRPGRSRNYGVHRLMAMAFLGGVNHPDLDVRHLDDIRLNNVVHNLAWGTRLDNEADKRRNGGHYCTQKKECPRGHALKAPNLVPSAVSANGLGRSCLACSRGMSYVKYYKNRHMDVNAVSDDYYRNIMESVA